MQGLVQDLIVKIQWDENSTIFIHERGYRDESSDETKQCNKRWLPKPISREQ